MRVQVRVCAKAVRARALVALAATAVEAAAPVEAAAMIAVAVNEKYTNLWALTAKLWRLLVSLSLSLAKQNLEKALSIDPESKNIQTALESLK